MADTTLAGPARFTLATLPLLPSADLSPLLDTAAFTLQTLRATAVPDSPPCLDLAAFELAVLDPGFDAPTTSDDAWLYA